MTGSFDAPRRQWLVGAMSQATLVSLGALASACVSRPATADAIGLLTLDAQALVDARRAIAAQDPRVMPALAALERRAARALAAPLRSVTDKTLLPPSSDRRDYMSMGPYWWPNPATANGLPYVRRDGQRNPQVAGDALDADRLQALCRDVFDLTLAAYFAGHDAESGYATKAAAAIRHWFLAPASAMSPHLRYGQSIPGIVEGRAEGLIDTRNLWQVIDAAALLRQHGALSADEYSTLRDWFARFARWMQDSEIGRQEAAAANNHGMFYDAQLANYLLFTSDLAGARIVLEQVGPRRFARQFAPDGSMPHELARTMPFHYSAFNLEAAVRLARHADGLRARGAASTPDLWRMEFHGRSLCLAIAQLAGIAVQPDRWTHATAVEKAPAAAKLLPVLPMARRAGALIDPQTALFERLLAQQPEAMEWLLWPLA